MPVHTKEVYERITVRSKSKKTDWCSEYRKIKLTKMLEQMFLTRFFEENAEALYIRGLVHGTMHLSIGMEASPIGSMAAIQRR